MQRDPETNFIEINKIVYTIIPFLLLLVVQTNVLDQNTTYLSRTYVDKAPKGTKSYCEHNRCMPFQFIPQQQPYLTILCGVTAYDGSPSPYVSIIAYLFPVPNMHPL